MPQDRVFCGLFRAYLDTVPAFGLSGYMLGVALRFPIFQVEISDSGSLILYLGPDQGPCQNGFKRPAFFKVPGAKGAFFFNIGGSEEDLAVDGMHAGIIFAAGRREKRVFAVSPRQVDLKLLAGVKELIFRNFCADLSQKLVRALAG